MKLNHIEKGILGELANQLKMDQRNLGTSGLCNIESCHSK
jgi:hypothetical protein